MRARVRSVVLSTTCALALTTVAAPTVNAAPLPVTNAAARAVAAATSAKTVGHTSAATATTKRGRAAVRWAGRVSHFPTRTCMVFVRTALHVGARYTTPRIAWSHASHRHRSALTRIPAGVPVYTVGRSAPGHIVLSLGNGKVRSTDWPRPGRVGTVKLRKLLRAWGHTYLGWSEDLNGVRVWHR